MSIDHTDDARADGGSETGTKQPTGGRTLARIESRARAIPTPGIHRRAAVLAVYRPQHGHPGRRGRRTRPLIGPAVAAGAGLLGGGAISWPITCRSRGSAGAAASSLRMFLVDCPDCGTPLEDATAVSCCGGYNGDDEVPEETLVCPNCRVRVFTFD